VTRWEWIKVALAVVACFAFPFAYNLALEVVH
jgi:hypothetical protein